ncbi:MAG: ATP-binding cassette domain-containing protein [Oscillospiraceae bacterium]|nr:ATP-binding cassette domain-containing protein [Oscillospiraceae bacterium]
MNYIEVKNVNKSFKNKYVLTEISLSLDKGRCYGFVGHNGCGKSMLMKAICGYIETDCGIITVNGKQIIGGKKFIENAGVLIEAPQWMGLLTGYQNLKILADIQKIIGDAELLEALALVGLKEEKDKKVRKYSLGMKQRLRIAQAIMEDPEILVLDEPFNGLDKDGVKEMQDLMKLYKKRNKTILLCSHDERQIEYLCDVVYEISEGRLVK